MGSGPPVRVTRKNERWLYLQNYSNGSDLGLNNLLVRSISCFKYTMWRRKFIFPTGRLPSEAMSVFLEICCFFIQIFFIAVKRWTHLLGMGCPKDWGHIDALMSSVEGIGHDTSPFPRWPLVVFVFVFGGVG